MMDQAAADHFAEEWIRAWNSHDLDAILSHYLDEIEFVSPVAVRLLQDPTGTVRGKEALRSYFAKGLEAYPDLHFKLIQVLPGVASLTLYYESVNDLMAAEVMELSESGLVKRVQAHYTPKSSSDSSIR